MIHDYQSLLQTSLTELGRSTTLTRISPGSKARAILEIVCARLAAFYQTLDVHLANAFVATAQGIYLDLLGDLLACPRRLAQAAQVDAEANNLRFYVTDGTFGDLTGGQPLTIPRGTQIATQPLSLAATNGVIYRLQEEVVAPAAASEIFVGAMAEVLGRAGNVPARALIHHGLTAYPTLQVENLEPIVNGFEGEDDESYRHRLARWLTAAPRANYTSLYLACLSLPGVAQVSFRPYSQGAGTFEIYVATPFGAPNTELLQLLQSVVDQYQALGVRGIVRPPVVIGIEAQIQVVPQRALNAAEQQLTESQLQEAARNHLGLLGLGQVFSSQGLLVELMQASPLIQSIGKLHRPFQSLYLWRPSRRGTGRQRQLLLGDYQPSPNEVVRLEKPLDIRFLPPGS